MLHKSYSMQARICLLLQWALHTLTLGELYHQWGTNCICLISRFSVPPFADSIVACYSITSSQGMCSQQTRNNGEVYTYRSIDVISSSTSRWRIWECINVVLNSWSPFTWPLNCPKHSTAIKKVCIHHYSILVCQVNISSCSRWYWCLLTSCPFCSC